MDIRIKNMNIVGFKGIESLSLDLDGKNCCISGDNGTGKSSIFDAFMWLFSGKDSKGRADFEIKPVNRQGDCSVSVSATLLVNGKERAFMRILTEKWVKKRGSAESEFSGHTTDYYMDEAPVQKKVYDYHIEALFKKGDVDFFGVISSPTGFNNLSWQQMRDILLNIVPALDIDGFERLPEILKKRAHQGIPKSNAIDMAKITISDSMKKIAKTMDGIPSAINALQASIKLHNIDPDVKASLQKEKQALENKLRDILSGVDVSEKIKEKNVVDSEIARLEGEEERLNSATKRDIAVLKSEFDDRTMKISSRNDEIEEIEKEIKSLNDERVILISRWKSERDLQFIASSECQTCGQPLPEHMIEDSRKRFSAKKAKKMASIHDIGSQKKVRREELGFKISEKLSEIELLSNKMCEIKVCIEEKEGSIVKPDTKALESRSNALDMEIDAYKNGAEIRAHPIRDQIKEIDSKLSWISTLEADNRSSERIKAQIEEKKEDEKRLAKDYSSHEADLKYLNDYIFSVARAQEEKINNLFNGVTFRLFEQRVNGDIIPKCEALVDGVPYSDLNTGERIKSGIRIIAGLSKYFDLTAPIWVDGAESVTGEIKTGSQVIRLVVDENEKELKIERSEA